MVVELRRQVQQLREEKAALQLDLARRDRWVEELRSALEALQSCKEPEGQDTSAGH
jgi:hypothetical protein